MPVLLLLIAIGDVAVLELSSPGLVPSMHSNYINSYAPDLTFTETIVTFPMLSSPSAIEFSPNGDLFIAEACDPPPCRQIERHDSAGFATPFGAPIHDSVRSMKFLPSGDMIVLLSGVLARLDAEGRWIDSTPLPTVQFLGGFDVDRGQCTAVFAALDRIGFASVCSREDARLVSVPGNVFDVRFLPDGNVLAAAAGAVYELDRSGNIVRRFLTSGGVTLLAIDPDGDSFHATAGNLLFGFDFKTGDALGPPASLRNAAYGAISMAIRGEWRAAFHPSLRRRSASR